MSTAITTPFTILIDTREQLAYTFADLHADARQRRRPLAVQAARGTLDAGDYSLLGHEHEIAIERKSPEDLFNTIGQGRARFVRELQRLGGKSWSAVVVEAGWSELLQSPPVHSRLPPKIVFRSVIAWQQRFPRTHWWFCAGRRHAEVVTFRLLERWWRQRGVGGGVSGNGVDGDDIGSNGANIIAGINRVSARAPGT